MRAAQTAAVLALAAILGRAQAVEQDIPRPPPEPCFFVSSDNITIEQSLIISSRCYDRHFMETETLDDRVVIKIDPRRCGVKDKSNLMNSVICYSDLSEGIGKSFHQSIWIANEEFHIDLTDYRRRKFRSKKKQIETHWNHLLLKDDKFRNWDFERVVIIRFSGETSRKKRSALLDFSFTLEDPTEVIRDKRSTSDQMGLWVEAVVQFGAKGADITLNEFRDAWKVLMNTKSLGKFQLNNSLETIEDVGRCPPIESLSNQVPSTIWDSSAPFLDMNETVSWGGTVDLRCPDGRKFSFDNDSVSENDDFFSLTCTLAGLYKIPKYWPTCGDYCWLRLPEPPASSGLRPLIPSNTIPSGSHGTYVCKDPSLGIDKGSSPYFRVICISGPDYEAPTEGNWPVCMKRTTTIRPIIKKALSKTREEISYNLKLRRMSEYSQEHHVDDQEIFMNDKVKIQNVTIPLLIVLLILVSCICWMTHIYSPCCNICAEKKKPKKVIKELKEDDDILFTVQ